MKDMVKTSVWELLEADWERYPYKKLVWLHNGMQKYLGPWGGILH